MKRASILFTSIVGFLYLTLSSYKDGPAANTGHVAVTGCGTSTTCHGVKNTATSANITIKDGSTSITSQYTPGKQYQVTVSGSSSGKNKFGFQFSATNATNKQAGSFSAMPAGTKTSSAPGSLTVAEHSAPITATSGFSTTFDWTAPASGTGSVKLSLALNAVDGDNTSSGDAYNTSQVTLSEASTSVSNINAGNILKVYPNPASGTIYIAGITTAGYTISINDINGRTIKTQPLSTTHNAIDISALDKGVYYIQMTSKEDKQIAVFVKQ